MINRRDFLLCVAGVSALAGCQTSEEGGQSANPAAERVINAGPVSAYASDGVYSRYRDSGFFVVREGQKLFVLSATCTHKKCKLVAESDRSFYCKCHGSTFDPEGKVTNGPAKRDLPGFATEVNEQGQLLVKVPGG